MSVKYWLNFTKAENENQYLTNLTNNISVLLILVSLVSIGLIWVKPH